MFLSGGKEIVKEKLELYRLLDWLMRLPAELDREYKSGGFLQGSLGQVIQEPQRGQQRGQTRTS